jgi:hypothetical protein
VAVDHLAAGHSDAALPAPPEPVAAMLVCAYSVTAQRTRELVRRLEDGTASTRHRDSVALE